MSSKNRKNRFVAPVDWSVQLLQQNPIFSDLTKRYPLADYNEWPSLNDHNQWLQHTPIQLVPNEVLEQDGRYYEQFIASAKLVPTRLNNWHDFFGACIWGLFPQTKALLNQLHINEIAKHGLKQRGQLRNKLTLFDECGVIICLEPAAVTHATLLRQHQWQQSFVDRRTDWWQSIRPVIFGHAIYEMATAPFIGLTAKTLFIEVPAGFSQWSLTSTYAYLDKELLTQITSGVLLNPAQLTPLPLLGVPLWYVANQAPQFYSNQDYFRPKRR